MPPPVRLAIFDCDGTLVDSQANICRAMEHAFDLHGLEPPPRAAIRRIVGLSLVEAVRALTPHADDAFHRTLAGDYKQTFYTLRTENRFDPEPLFQHPQFERDFAELNRYYRETRLIQLRRVDGKLVLIETKRRGKAPTERQVKRLKEAREQGVMGFVFDGHPDDLALLLKWLTSTRQDIERRMWSRLDEWLVPPRILASES